MSASHILRRLRAELWQSPRAHGDVIRDRTVGPLELFYDLVVVALVAQSARQLSTDFALRRLIEFSIVFSIVWIAWLNGTLLHDLHGREDVRSRNSFLAQILLLVPLGGFIPRADAPHEIAFALTASSLFGLLGFLWWRVSRADEADFARRTREYVVVALMYAIGLGASAVLPPDDRLIVWAALNGFYLASVAITIARIPTDFDLASTVTYALNERFSAFVIIVLGEVVTGVVSGLATHRTTALVLSVGVASVCVGFGSWWTYFDFVGHRPPRSTRSSLTIWMLAHLPVSGAIACVGATMPSLVARAAGRPSASLTWMLCGGAAVVLIFTVVLMITLEDWFSPTANTRPTAIVALIAAVFALGVGLMRPAPLLLCVSLVLIFGTPWIFAVVRRAILTSGEAASYGSRSDA